MAMLGASATSARVIAVLGLDSAQGYGHAEVKVWADYPAPEPSTSDIFPCACGRDNAWTTTERYEHFIHGLHQERHQPVADAAEFKPLLVGVYWPSQAMKLREPEAGSSLAANDSVAQDVGSSPGLLD